MYYIAEFDLVNESLMDDNGIPLGTIIESVNTDTHAGILLAMEAFELECCIGSARVVAEGVDPSIVMEGAVKNFFRTIIEKIKEFCARVADFFKNLFTRVKASQTSNNIKNLKNTIEGTTFRQRLYSAKHLSKDIFADDPFYMIDYKNGMKTVGDMLDYIAKRVRLIEIKTMEICEVFYKVLDKKNASEIYSADVSPSWDADQKKIDDYMKVTEWFDDFDDAVYESNLYDERDNSRSRAYYTIARHFKISVVDMYGNSKARVCDYISEKFGFGTPTRLSDIDANKIDEYVHYYSSGKIIKTLESKKHETDSSSGKFARNTESLSRKYCITEWYDDDKNQEMGNYIARLAGVVNYSSLNLIYWMTANNAIINHTVGILNRGINEINKLTKKIMSSDSINESFYIKEDHEMTSNKHEIETYIREYTG